MGVERHIFEDGFRFTQISHSRKMMTTLRHVRVSGTSLWGSSAMASGNHRLFFFLFFEKERYPRSLKLRVSRIKSNPTSPIGKFGLDRSASSFVERVAVKGVWTCDANRAGHRPGLKGQWARPPHHRLLSGPPHGAR